MIVKEDFLNKLRQRFGLNLYEVKIWTALLSRGVSTAGELSDIGNVPRSRAYDVLESLEKKGFVVMKLGKPIKYIAVKPEEVVERVKKNIKVGAEKSIQRLKDLSGTELLSELTELHTKGIEFIEPSDLSGAVRGRHNLYNHLELMMKNAENSVVLTTTSKGILRKLEALTPIFSKLSKRNVNIRVAFPFSEETKEAQKNLSKYGEVKNVKDLNARFCIIDRKEILFMATNDKKIHPTYDVGVWVNTPFFAEALESMFDETWKKL